MLLISKGTEGSHYIQKLREMEFTLALAKRCCPPKKTAICNRQYKSTSFYKQIAFCSNDKEFSMWQQNKMKERKIFTTKMVFQYLIFSPLSSFTDSFKEVASRQWEIHANGMIRYDNSNDSTKLSRFKTSTANCETQILPPSHQESKHTLDLIDICLRP